MHQSRTMPFQQRSWNVNTVLMHVLLKPKAPFRHAHPQNLRPRIHFSTTTPRKPKLSPRITFYRATILELPPPNKYTDHLRDILRRLGTRLLRLHVIGTWHRSTDMANCDSSSSFRTRRIFRSRTQTRKNTLDYRPTAERAAPRITAASPQPFPHRGALKSSTRRKALHFAKPTLRPLRGDSIGLATLCFSRRVPDEGKKVGSAHGGLGHLVRLVAALPCNSNSHSAGSDSNSTTTAIHNSNSPPSK